MLTLKRSDVVRCLALLGMILFLASCLPDSNGSQKETATNEMIQLDKFLQGYYRAPQPEKVGEMLRLYESIAPTTESEITGIILPTIGFFSKIFEVNPERLGEWTKIIAEMKNKQFQLVMLYALLCTDSDAARQELKPFKKTIPELKDIDIEAKPPNLLQNGIEVTEQLDLCWGMFFASGDVSYPLKVLECAVSPHPPGGVDLTVGAARWSVLANARSHPVVKKTANDFFRRATQAQIRNFVQDLSFWQRVEFFDIDLLLKVSRLQALSKEGSEDRRIEPPAKGGKSLPPIGAKVDYESIPDIVELRKEAVSTHAEDHAQNGMVVVGRLLVEGQEGVAGVATKAVFGSASIFVAPVYAGRTLCFVKHGYEKLEIPISDKWSDVKVNKLDLGEQTLRKLSADKTKTVRVTVKLPEGISDAEVRLVTGWLPTIGHDDGYDGRAPTRALAERRRLHQSGELVFTGLADIAYDLCISAQGCIDWQKRFDAGKEPELGVAELRRSKIAQFSTRTFSEATAWIETMVLIDGKGQLVVAEKDALGNLPALDCKFIAEDRIEVSFTWHPCSFDDYGKLTPEEFDAKKQAGSLPNPRRSQGDAVLESGHLYRFRNAHLNIDILIVFRSLWEFEPSRDQPADHGRQNIHQAAATGDVAWLNRLLFNPSDPNARDLNLQTPLHLATIAKHQAAIDWLLNQGADADLPDKDGNTAIMLACQNHAAPELLIKLLKHTQNINQTNKAGRTALDFAEEFSPDSVLPKLLRAAGAKSLTP